MASDQPKGSPGSGLSLGRSLRCLGLLIILPIMAVVVIFLVAGQYQKEWTAARPVGLSDEAWTARKGLCETAKLGPSECGEMPAAAIEEAAAKQRAKERAELCQLDARHDAIRQAKEAVEERLRAPGTAKWSGIAATQNGCDWRVSGSLDAQNAFGGMVRSDFDVRLRRISRQTWVPLSVRVD
jgi:hypothetical protein